MARKELQKPPKMLNLQERHLYALFADHLLGATAGNAPTVLDDGELIRNRRIIFDTTPGAAGVAGGTAQIVERNKP